MPKTKKPQAQESFADMVFPTKGIDLAQGFGQQRSGTTPTGKNVRAFEPTTNRARGGARPGLARYINAQLSGAHLVQELAVTVGTGYNPPTGVLMETSQSGRVVTLVAVSQGNVRVAAAGDTLWTTPTNGNGALNTVGIVLSAANQQKLWFVDGTHWKYYDPSANQVFPWTASAGNLPTDAAGNAPRLICTWRGRTVLSGLLKDPQNWFMSAVNDPTNFDYSPLSSSPTQAIAGNNSPAGLIGDVVTSLIPYNDDVLLLGCDHTIWLFNGDPMAGGQIDLVSDAIGVAWGVPWTKDPYGTVYFVSNRMGIYSLRPAQNAMQAGVQGNSGAGLQRISQPIEQLLVGIDTGANTIRLIWDDRFQGLHVFVSPTAAPASTTHFFWEQRSGAWWTDVFGSTNYDPLCCVVFDGNAAGDRVPLIGSWGGYVRAINATATTDDGTAIASQVVLGPLLTKDLDDVLLKDVQAVLASASGTVTYSVYLGVTAEIALASTPVATGTWSAGRNFSNHIRRAGHAIYVQLSATSPWAMETVRARLAGLGKVRRRDGH